MRDRHKTKAQLIEELEQLRRKSRAEGKNVEEALEESEHKFRSLAESTTAHISIIQDDRYVYANQAFLDYFEMDPEDLSWSRPRT